jgi:hypothetical protein
LHINTKGCRRRHHCHHHHHYYSLTHMHTNFPPFFSVWNWCVKVWKF